MNKICKENTVEIVTNSNVTISEYPSPLKPEYNFGFYILKYSFFLLPVLLLLSSYFWSIVPHILTQCAHYNEVYVLFRCRIKYLLFPYLDTGQFFNYMPCNCLIRKVI